MNYTSMPSTHLSAFFIARSTGKKRPTSEGHCSGPREDMKLSLCMKKTDTQRHSLREFEAILRTFRKIDFLESGRDPGAERLYLGGPSIKTEYNLPKQLKTSKKQRRKNIEKH